VGTTPSSGIVRWPIPLGRLIGLPVRIDDADGARVADVVLDRAREHVLGLVVGSGHERRFLPWAVARVEHDHVATRSAASLFSPDELDFYVGNGARLAAELGETNGAVVDEGGVVSAADGDGLGLPSPRAAEGT
jgi:hypothetical protein